MFTFLEKREGEAKKTSTIFSQNWSVGTLLEQFHIISIFKSNGGEKKTDWLWRLKREGEHKDHHHHHQPAEEAAAQLA
jgi:hypothetical protein